MSAAVRRQPAYNPGLRRHTWRREREHHRSCPWCGIRVENHPGTRGRWWQSWTWPNGTHGHNQLDATVNVPSCPGPVLMHLADRHTAAPGVTIKTALVAACELVVSLADADGRPAADRTAVGADVLHVLRAVERVVGVGDTVALSAREVAAVAAVTAEAVGYWSVRAGDDGLAGARVRVVRAGVFARLARSGAWPGEVPRDAGICR